MTRVLTVALCTALGSCGSAEPREDPTANRPAPSEEGEPTPTAPGAGRPLPRCGTLEAGTQPLTSYEDLEAGEAIYHVTVARDESTGEWIPTPLPRMPHNHATRLEWTNAADFPELETSRERLRFTLQVLSRDVQRITDSRWNALFRAHIESVCSLTTDMSRPEGLRLASIGLDTSACHGLEAGVAAAAAEAATCTRDDDCVIRHVPVCEVRGLGCYWAAVSRSRPQAPLDEAIQRLLDGPCPIASCDCQTPPDAARCVDGHCMAP